MLLVCAFFFSYHFSSAVAVSQGAVRFVRNGYASTSQGWSSGIVQIYYSGRWGNICDGYNFGYTEADVLCHQFSYSGSSSHTSTYLSNSYGSDSADAVLDDVNCRQSSFLSITQCTLTTTTTLSTSCHNDIIVSCYSTRIWNYPTSGDIRLTGGMYSNQGLLEVYCNGQWGTVCDDNFYSTQATVACKQLGYNDYKNYNHLTQRGISFQSIWLKSLSSCTPCQSCLTQCSEGCPLSAVTVCFHSEDVTLECEFDFFKPDVFTTKNTVCRNNIYRGDATDCADNFDPTDFSSDSTDPFDTYSPTNETDSPNPTDSTDSRITGHQLIGIIIGFVIMGCLLTTTVPLCIAMCVLVKKRSQQTTTATYTQMATANNPEYVRSSARMEERNPAANQAEGNIYSDPPGRSYNNRYEQLQRYEVVDHYPESLPPSYSEIYHL